MLTAWTRAAERMTQGQDAGTYGAVNGPYDAPPEDTGEAIGLPASGLTLTFGFGPSLFSAHPSLGLSAKRPAALVDLPKFAGDNLDPATTGGDLCVQACAQDPQVAVHAIRNLARIGFGTAAVRWSQLGFGRTSSTSTAQATPRNLFGFKDGTANLKAEDTSAVDQHVWVQPGDGSDWMTNGSYLIARRIRMNIETWDRGSLHEQEDIIGRTKATGSPLSGGEEFTNPDFSMKGATGPIIPVDSHVSVVHPDHNNGAQLLRRGYNFVDGSDKLGRLDAGLFFLAYVRDPRNSFIPMQAKMAKEDAMMEYLQPVGSGIWAVPPGVKDDREFIGSGLFA